MIVPYLRGYGTTRFLSSETVRNGQPSALAVDVDRLHGRSQDREGDPRRLRLGRADGQHRRGALAGARARPLVSVSGYLIGSQEAGKMPLPPKAELEWWYQFYFATERGRAGYDKYRRDFSKLIWQIASPKWEFDDATFDRSAAAFDNPDHVAIVIHNYRWRLGLAEGEPKYDDLEKRLADIPGDHGADHHPRRRCQWRTTPGSQRLCEEILRQVRAPAHHRRHRAQPAAGSAAGLRPGRHRRRREG